MINETIFHKLIQEAYLNEEYRGVKEKRRDRRMRRRNKNMKKEEKKEEKAGRRARRRKDEEERKGERFTQRRLGFMRRLSQIS